ncbi:MAG TPA: MMPL family transporter [Solirubrobacteraceae bacterium]
MLDALARRLHRRRRRVLIGTLAFVVLAAALGAPVAGILDDDGDFQDKASESARASSAVLRASGAAATPSLVVLVRLGEPIEAPAARRRLVRVAGALRADRALASVTAYDGSPATGALVSRDRRSTYLLARFRAGADWGDAARRVQDRFARDSGIVVGGGELAGEQVGEQVSEDLARAELLAFPILFLLSLWVFRGLVAALLPLAVGMTTIFTTFLLIRFVNGAVTGLSVFALNLIIGLGLGLAIDYSLFVISRFREELERAGGDVAAALRATLRTAGRTVLFSSVTVAAALASLTVFPQRFLYSMGIGGALCALVAAAAALIVLPALLAALGPRIDALSPERWRRAAHRDATAVRSGFWYRLSRAVMRRPGRIAAACALVLVAAGLPFQRIEFTGVDPSVLPESRSARVVDDAVRADFASDSTAPIFLSVAAGREDAPAVRAYAARVAGAPGVVSVSEPEALRGGGWRIDVVARGSALDEAAQDAVAAVRAVPAPFTVLAGGYTAAFVDQQASLADHLPLALALLALTTLVILFLMTGSVVLPVKTLVMNLLTLSAAFGLLVLIFQDGRLQGPLGFEGSGALDSTQPILLFAIAFGLSTDYGVFLLTRIKEARDRGASDDEAVALGLERTGRIVTAAALLFCVAIGAFATSKIIFIKQVGVGTALAVAIDATIVRALLVPSLMKLLGRWNWWAPRPLARLHARFGLSEGGAGA